MRSLYRQRGKERDDHAGDQTHQRKGEGGFEAAQRTWHHRFNDDVADGFGAIDNRLDGGLAMVMTGLSRTKVGQRDFGGGLRRASDQGAVRQEQPRSVGLQEASGALQQPLCTVITFFAEHRAGDISDEIANRGSRARRLRPCLDDAHANHQGDGHDEG